MPRQTITNRYINQVELDSQLGGLVAETSGKEHAEAVHASLDSFNNEWNAKVAAGNVTPEEIAERNLILKLNAMSQHENHSDRWQRQHDAYQKVEETEAKIDGLNRQYRAGKIDDATYWQRMAKYSGEAEEAKKNL